MPLSPRTDRPSICPREFIDFGNRIADAVAEIHRRHFRQGVAVEIKDDGSPVTAVDRMAEQVVRQLLAEKFPDHGVLGEEFPAHRPDADYVWVVDPLDGTQLYVMGRPLFGFLLALAHRGRFILGVIDHAALGERWVGADGHGTVLNGAPVRTRACAALQEAALVRPGRTGIPESCSQAVDAVAEHGRWVQWGVTPYDYGLLAAGHLDLVLSAGPKLHDLAPLDPVIRNAGGAVADWNGAPLSITSEGSLIACGDPGLLPQVLASLHATG